MQTAKKTRTRGPRVIWTLAIASIAIAGVAIAVFRDAIANECLLVRYRFAGAGDVDALAVELGERQYLRAIPHLIQAAKAERDAEKRIVASGWSAPFVRLTRSHATPMTFTTNSAPIAALAKFGRAALEPIRKAIEAPATPIGPPFRTDLPATPIGPPFQSDLPATLETLAALIEDGKTVEYGEVAQQQQERTLYLHSL